MVLCRCDQCDVVLINTLSVICTKMAHCCSILAPICPVCGRCWGHRKAFLGWDGEKMRAQPAARSVGSGGKTKCVQNTSALQLKNYLQSVPQSFWQSSLLLLSDCSGKYLLLCGLKSSFSSDAGMPKRASSQIRFVCSVYF